MRIKYHDIKIKDLKHIKLINAGKITLPDGCQMGKTFLLGISTSKSSISMQFKTKFNRNWAIVKLILAFYIKFGRFPNYSFNSYYNIGDKLDFYGLGNVHLKTTQL